MKDIKEFFADWTNFREQFKTLVEKVTNHFNAAEKLGTQSEELKKVTAERDQAVNDLATAKTSIEELQTEVKDLKAKLEAAEKTGKEQGETIEGLKDQGEKRAAEIVEKTGVGSGTVEQTTEEGATPKTSDQLWKEYEEIKKRDGQAAASKFYRERREIMGL